jgi:aminopeptidase N
MVEPTSRTSYFAGLASGSLNPGMVGKLNTFAQTVPASARPAITRTIAAINFRQDIIKNRLPQVDGWLAAHPEVARPLADTSARSER